MNGLLWVCGGRCASQEECKEGGKESSSHCNAKDATYEQKL